MFREASYIPSTGIVLRLLQHYNHSDPASQQEKKTAIRFALVL